jgi:hypothetical protein
MLALTASNRLPVAGKPSPSPVRVPGGPNDPTGETRFQEDGLQFAVHVRDRRAPLSQEALEGFRALYVVQRVDVGFGEHLVGDIEPALVD